MDKMLNYIATFIGSMTGALMCLYAFCFFFGAKPSAFHEMTLLSACVASIFVIKEVIVDFIHD